MTLRRLKWMLFICPTVTLISVLVALALNTARVEQIKREQHDDVQAAVKRSFELNQNDRAARYNAIHADIADLRRLLEDKLNPPPRHNTRADWRQ